MAAPVSLRPGVVPGSFGVGAVPAWGSCVTKFGGGGGAVRDRSHEVAPVWWGSGRGFGRSLVLSGGWFLGDGVGGCRGEFPALGPARPGQGRESVVGPGRVPQVSACRGACVGGGHRGAFAGREDVHLLHRRSPRIVSLCAHGLRHHRRLRSCAGSRRPASCLYSCRSRAAWGCRVLGFPVWVRAPPQPPQRPARRRGGLYDNGRRQTILGLGFEVQPDCIGFGNNGREW